MKLTSEKGSIAIYVIVGLLFMTTFLLILNTQLVNKSKTTQEQFEILSDIYLPNESNQISYEKAYTDLRNQRKETGTKSVENNSFIELKNTFEGSLSNYRIYGSGEKIEINEDLPEEYQQVEYLESTGTQYIDTEYVNSGDYYPYKIEADFQYTDVSNTGNYVFGTSKTSATNYPLGFGTSIKGKWLFMHYGGGSSGVSWDVPDTDRHTVKYVFGEAIYFDGKLLEHTVEQAKISSNSERNIGLFAAIKDKTPTAYSKLKLYSCKFYEADDVLVRDFVPCYRKFDNVAGLYDVVYDNFYTNQGTGDFVIGEDVLEENIRKNLVGDLVTDANDVNYGKYQISIQSSNRNGERITNDIFLTEPLEKDEYIDFKTNRVIRNDGIEEYINLPKVPIYEDYTKIEILTEVIPLNIEVEYQNYELKYKKLEYIESTGTQYIDTGITCNPDLKIETKYYIPSFEVMNNYIFGAYDKEGKYRTQYYHSDASIFVGFGDKYKYLNPLTDYKQYSIVMDKGKFILDGEEIYDATDANYTYSLTNQASIYLFARNGGGDVGMFRF